MDEEKDDVHMEAEELIETTEEESTDKAESKIANMREELSACRKEKQEYMDGWQRAKADYVNALKRFDEEKLAARERGAIEAVKTLLPALDAIERARSHGDIPEGFQAIVRQLESAFAGLAIEPYGTVGDRFDPALHEALGKDPAESEEDGRVTAVLEKGWRTGNTIIRPAKVRVAHRE